MVNRQPQTNHMTILVIGSGGREHVLAWSLSHSPRVQQVIVAPGNAGTPNRVPIAADDVAGLLHYAREHEVDLVVVGPEAALAVGIVDAFQEAGIPIFGPTKAASQLETSKIFAKTFMRQHHIPTADYAVFDDYDAAHHYILQHAQRQTPPAPLVVKADGLAAGKGVLICQTPDDAIAAIDRIMRERAFGNAGDRVLIEECLAGPEVSCIAFCDGHSFCSMPPSRDHKRVFDGDGGPNTGGMGAYAPPPDVDAALIQTIEQTVIQPTLDGMAAQGMPYVGMLYAGLMLTVDGPKVLEFNCRFGDPEAQALLPLLNTTNPHAPTLLDILLACLDTRLDQLSVQWHSGACATIVLASGGYPGSYRTGIPITGLDQPAPSPDSMIFHAGTEYQDGQIVTNGGRVLAVSARAPTLPGALSRAYQHIQGISFEGMHYRRDIGSSYGR